MNLENGVIQVHLDDVIPNRFQPRVNFDESAITELSESIKQHGIIQPLVLRKCGEKYEIIAGERRYKAATLAGLTTVPAVIANIDDNTSAEVALVENIQRKDLSAIEEARSYKNLLDRGYLTQEELAKKMGLSQSAVSNKMRLLNLDEEVQAALMNEKISERHARSLLQIADKTEQKSWLQRIIRERMTVRQLEQEIKKISSDSEEAGGEIPLVNLTPNIEDIKTNAADLHPIEEKKFVEEFFETKTEDLKEPELKPDTSQIPRKFFNFLEDEAVNLNVDPNPNQIFKENSNILSENSQIDLNNIQVVNNEEKDINNQIDNENIEILDMPLPNTNQKEVLEVLPKNNFDDGFNPLYQPENDPKNINIPALEPDILPDNFSFEQPVIEQVTFNPILNTPIEKPTYEQNSPTEHVFEAPRIEKEIIDPISRIDLLDPNYEQKVAEETGRDLKSAITIVRQCSKDIEERGFIIDVDEIDFSDSYQITIKIQK